MSKSTDRRKPDTSMAHAFKAPYDTLRDRKTTSTNPSNAKGESKAKLSLKGKATPDQVAKLEKVLGKVKAAADKSGWQDYKPSKT